MVIVKDIRPPREYGKFSDIDTKSNEIINLEDFDRDYTGYRFGKFNVYS